MRYFTPELIARYGADDPSTWKDAEQRWEDACDQYEAYLASIRVDFPPGLRRVEDSYHLHDAMIRGMGRRDGTFVIMLQLDAPPHSLLTISYNLVEEPVIREAVVAPECRSSAAQVEWQYDEVDRVASQPPTWRQSILLSNGWEVGLHFRDLTVEEIQALLPQPRNGAADVPGPALPQTA